MLFDDVNFLNWFGNSLTFLCLYLFPFNFPLTGCKIKALRAKTNTYIKTPVRGEQPVFVVTGRKEDVAMAKREILSAAEHFSLIRASRNKTGPLSAATGPGTPSLPGQTTIQVSKHIQLCSVLKLWNSNSYTVNHITCLLAKCCVCCNKSTLSYKGGCLCCMFVIKAYIVTRVISTLQVRVPYRVVGLVVGPKGWSVINHVFQ